MFCSVALVYIGQVEHDGKMVRQEGYIRIVCSAHAMLNPTQMLE